MKHLGRLTMIVWRIIRKVVPRWIRSDSTTNSLLLSLPLYLLTASPVFSQPDLKYTTLAPSWDEGFPLGNGTLGALVWQKGDQLRLSLDRSDLWDLRPMAGLDRGEFRYDWVVEQVRKGEYKIVQEYFDAPYEREPAPTKIPGAAIEFNTSGWGTVVSAVLSLRDATCRIEWSNGISLTTFVHAAAPVGWFRFEKVSELIPQLITPAYEGAQTSPGGSVEGDNLSRLGYTQGKVAMDGNTLIYRQEGWGGFHYEVAVSWKRVSSSVIEGVWTISSHFPRQQQTPAGNIAANTISKSFGADATTHSAWWKKYWEQSAIQVPDTLIHRQWYLEQYKFGSASRQGAPPISLQAVWTADNGRIPPWKGDYHHDLNTQLSYWPCYSGNHLDEGLAYLDHLDANKENYKRYTQLFFGKEGIAVPGVTTLDGTEMGGWIQYSLSPTISAWLAHHYYLHWRYSMDRAFLKERAYPWIRDVAVFLDQMSIRDDKGFRKLPLGSSPEINNNSITAWFTDPTNYDLALMRFTYSAAAELASELGLKEDATRWARILNELPPYAITADNELMFAPSLPYNESHRHFSHLMAIHPLGLIRWEDGGNAQQIIKNSIARLRKIGPDWWTGYSYAWLANLEARARNGEGASEALTIFARAFCLKNSFHVNGDQTKSGFSKFTYRPFTLEGNFAFASGLQEMLLQSYAGVIEIMPAIPAHWHDVSFDKLRTEGAFIVSARRSKGNVTEVTVQAEQGGILRLKMPFQRYRVNFQDRKRTIVRDGHVELTLDKGETVQFLAR